MSKSWKKSLRYGAASFAVAAASAFGSACAAEPVQFDIEAAPLGDALRAFGIQSGMSVLFSEKLVRGHEAPALEGEYEPGDALAMLLEGSGLEFVHGPNDNLIIRESAAAPIKTSAPSATSNSPREEEPDVDALNDEPDDARPEAEESELRAERVTVTGTNIRGFAPESSPLDIYTRDDILESGVASTEQFIRTLPQNFGGGSTEFARAGLPNDLGSQRNVTFGSGANLRGLGSKATLVLLNGNRIAPSSTIGGFVDLSLIPVSAIERVDVLTDGASSIYGGDAVAGVINFVTRSDFEGSETAYKYGSVTDGSLDEYRVGQTLGTAWGGGNVLATYEYYDRDSLKLSDRPELAVPNLTSGDPISNVNQFDLLPAQQRHSALVSARQELGPDLSVSATGLYSRRDVYSSNVLALSSSFLSVSDTTSENTGVSADIEYDISTNWIASLSATYNETRNHEVASIFVGATPFIAESEFGTDLWSTDLLFSGELFSLPGGAVDAAFGGHFRREAFDFRNIGADPMETDRDVSALFAELLIPLIGTENAFSGVRALELNLSARYDDYSDFGSSTNPKIGVLWAPSASLNIRSSYSTSFSPPALGLNGRFDRTASISTYSVILTGIGGTLPDPALGGVDYMNVGGTDLALDPETSRAVTAGFDWQKTLEESQFSLSGTYYDIDFDDRPGSTPIPGNINRNFAPEIALRNPELLPPDTVIFFPTPAQVSEILASLIRPPSIRNGASIDNIGIINQASVIRNLASTETRGIDAQVSYSTHTSFGEIRTSLNANYIIDFTQRAAKSTPKVNAINTLYNPVDMQLRGSVGLARDGFNGNVFINYKDSYKTDSTPSAKKVDAWTTIDVTLAYTFDRQDNSILGDTSFSLSILNIFDAAPPEAPSFGSFSIAGYDPANASPLKRFFTFEISKRF